MVVSLEWMAGFFDGEGYIGIRKHRASLIKMPSSWYRLVVTITNNDILPLKTFLNRFGGRIHQNNQNVYQYVLDSNDIINFIEAIYPYCILKQNQLLLGKEFLTLPRTRGKDKETILAKKDKIYQQMMGIKKSKSGRKRKELGNIINTT